MKYFSLAFCALLLSCEARVNEGVVVNKSYEEGQYITVSRYNVIYKMVMLERVWDDEDYVVIVKGWNGSDTVYQRFEITRDHYMTYNIGDSIRFK